MTANNLALFPKYKEMLILRIYSEAENIFGREITMVRFTITENPTTDQRGRIVVKGSLTYTRAFHVKLVSVPPIELSVVVHAVIDVFKPDNPMFSIHLSGSYNEKTPTIKIPQNNNDNYLQSGGVLIPKTGYYEPKDS